MIAIGVALIDKKYVGLNHTFSEGNWVVSIQSDAFFYAYSKNF